MPPFEMPLNGIECAERLFASGTDLGPPLQMLHLNVALNVALFGAGIVTA